MEGASAGEFLMSVTPTPRVRSGALLLVAAALLTPAALARLDGQQTTPTSPPAQHPQFRAGTDTVPVYVTVRDEHGNFVLNLTQDDFEVRDNGHVQTITQFTTAVQPLTSVVLIDGSGSMMPEFNRAIQGADDYVLRMLPGDRARIGSFADKVVFGPHFTFNRDELLKYLEDQFNLRVGGETHLWEAIRDSADVLNGQPGKRVVLAMSDGYNFVLPADANQPLIPGPGSVPPPIQRGPGLSQPRQPLISTAPNIGDPAHNGVPMEEARGMALEANAIVYAVSMWVRDPELAKPTRPNHDLEQLALETGGAFYQVREDADMNPVFSDIVQQLRQQYVLGFTPKSFDGKRHTLEVHVKPHSLKVQARKSYVATRGGGQQE
jgi:Ca-activated chloride channel homolog